MPPDTAIPATEPRWLSDDEQRTWRRLAAVILKLPAELEAQLQRDADMSHFEYWVISMLSECPDRRLRLSHLAQQTNASLSRLSHVITRLEQHGWVRREPCPDDARAVMAQLTEEGWATVVATAPCHVEAVRRMVFDGLPSADVDHLGDACETILDQIQAAPQGA